MIALILLSLTGSSWPTERPSVEEFVARSFFISSRGIGDGILSQAPMPTGPLRHAKVVLLGEYEIEIKCEFFYDDEHRLVRTVDWGVFGLEPEYETIRKFDSCGDIRSTRRNSRNGEVESRHSFEYDADCTWIGSESDWGSSSETNMRVPSTDPRETVILVRRIESRGKCVDEVHRVSGDANGRVLTHFVERDGRRTQRLNYVLDEEGRVERVYYSNPFTEEAFVITIEYAGERTSLVTWGAHGEVLKVEDRHATPNGLVIVTQNLNAHRRRDWTQRFDRAGDLVEWTHMSDAIAPETERYEYVRDARGNLVEYHVRSGPPRGNSHRDWNGYRIEIEYVAEK